MRIYLDYQIWDHINKDSKLKTFFQSIPGWQYLISVAHIEEIYRARKNESPDKYGVTDMLENTIKELSDNGVITPTAEAGLKFIPQSYADAYKRIVEYDTVDIVNKFSQEKRIYDQEKYDARTLFKGKPHTKENEYKLVWDIDRVQKELDDLNKYLLPMLNSVTFSEDQIEEISKIYGKSAAEKIIEEFPSKSVIKIEPFIYNQIRDNYFKLEFVVDRLFSILNTCGFYRDKKVKTANSGTYDIQHAICSTICDIFVTDDSNFAIKYKAVAFYLGIPITIKTLDELLDNTDWDM